MSTIYDIAKKAGVSTATVSRVINGGKGVSSKTREKVTKVLEKTGYIPNSNAGSLRSCKTKIIAVVIPDIKNPYFNNVASGIEERAFARGYNLFFCSTNEDLEREVRYVHMLIEKRVAGVIMIPASNKNSHLRVFNENGIPVVFLDRRVNGIKADCIESDDREAARKLVKHLISLGHKRIGIISGPTELSTGRERLQGYLDALNEGQIPVNYDYICTGENNELSAYNLTIGLLELEDTPEAIFAATNSITKGAIKAIHDKDLTIPKNIALVSFDGIDTYPFITAIEQHAYIRGGIAGDLLIDRIEKGGISEPKNITLKTELIVRESCGSKNTN